MAKAPTRIVGPALIAAGPTTVYTVPAVTKTVLRYIHVSNPTAGAVNFTLSIGADAAATRLWQTFSIAAAVVEQFWVMLPMEAAEILTISTGTAGVMTITIGADVYTLG